jgi:hypothetical protein
MFAGRCVYTIIPIEPGGTIKRSVEWVDENSLDLVVSESGRSGRIRETQKRRLTRNGRCEAYQLVNELEEKQRGWFVSGCWDTPPNKFLAHGCQLRY